MKFKVPSFSDRRAKIKTVEDIQAQLALAKKYVRRIENAMAASSLHSERLELKRALDDANTTVRLLRQKVFDIEDEITGGLKIKETALSPASSVGNEIPLIADDLWWPDLHPEYFLSKSIVI